MMALKNNTLPCTWITANQRLALHFRQQHDRSQQLLGKKIWETLDCVSLRAWILRTYQASPEATQFVLSEAQALALWESVISHSLADMQPELAFLSTRTLAKTAQGAWRLLKEAQVPLRSLSAADSPEVAAFLQWARAFEQRCLEKNCLDLSTCIDHVITAINHNQITLPDRIVLAGYEEIPQQTQQLFRLLSERCVLQRHQEELVPDRVQRTSAANEELELQLMAQWAFKLHTQNPTASIGCVVPELLAKRHLVERIFKQVFKAQQPVFNLSGGSPFHHVPLIQTAFDILRCGVAMVDMTRLSRLLLSPFLGGAEREWVARAAFDIQLREMQEPQLPWQKTQELAKKRDDCAIWLLQCERYGARYATTERYQNACAWGQHFAAQLQDMGWPGERAVNSSEYQQIKRWQALLEEFGHLDVILEKPLSRAEALGHLYHLAQAVVFQSETGSVPVQVLGLLEAVGLSFDALWVSGMTAGTWPAKASPHPFIPMTLQREYDMPHASAERELAYSQALTKRFCQSASWVVFSYAAQQEDQLQMPSSLIAGVLEIPAKELVAPVEPIANLAAIPMSTPLEYIEDEYAPPLQTAESYRGGANLFKCQAACPFQAFARTRLDVASMPVPAFSMTARERGICFHMVLERVWGVLKDHQTLCQHNEAALAEIVRPIVVEVLKTIAKNRTSTLKSRFLALEQDRLVTQVVAWLAVEKQRPPFKVVALEATQQVQFAGLPLKIRVDREDELEDGTRIIIDYKTGICSPSDWLSERPDDPQLPLYGLTCEYSIGGLVFAQISADKLQFSGLSEQDCAIPGVQPITQRKSGELGTWDNFFTATKITLTHLAVAFQKGYAKVDPKQEQTCRHCDLQGFCRINEQYYS